MKLKRLLIMATLSTSMHAGILNDIIQGNSQGVTSYLTQSLNTGIPGMGAIKISCEVPKFNLPSLDFCSIENKIREAIPDLTIPDLEIGDSKCGIKIPLSQSGCQLKASKRYCNETKTLIQKQTGLGLLQSGIGGWMELGKKDLALFGGKGIFGKNLCGSDEKRYKVLRSANMKKIYGKDGYMKQTVIKHRNRRNTSAYFKCLEAAAYSGLPLGTCNLNHPRTAKVSKPTQVESKISDYAGVKMKAPTGNLASRISLYWPAFKHYANKYGLTNARLLMAIGIHESKLVPNAKGGLNPLDGTRDWGMMQINDKYHKATILKRYPHDGGWPAAIFVSDNAIDYGAYYFKKDCVRKFGQNSWTSVNCYNKGPKRTHIHDSYVPLVKKAYASLDPALYPNGGSDDMYVRDVKVSQKASANLELSTAAVQRKRTMTHIGQDTVERLPIEKRAKYVQTVNRYMAQSTLVKASDKKASEIEKALLHLHEIAGSTYIKNEEVN